MCIAGYDRGFGGSKIQPEFASLDLTGGLGVQKFSLNFLRFKLNFVQALACIAGSDRGFGAENPCLGLPKRRPKRVFTTILLESGSETI